MDRLPIVTTSERSSFRRCPQQWWWRYRMGFTPRFPSADARWFGIGVHIALADWYLEGTKRGPHPAETFESWIGDEIAYMRADVTGDWEDEPKYEDARELGIAMLEEYVDQYGEDEEWDIIAIETPFTIQVKHYGRPIAQFKSTWDGVYRSEDDGRIYLLENKTAAQIDIAYLELDDQAGSYWAVATKILRARGVLKPGEKIAGIVYNFLRKAKPDQRPRDENGAYLNQNGSVSKKQPAPLFRRETVERSPREQKTQIARLTNEVALMNAVRQGVVPLVKNTTRDCARYCDFFKMCTLHERGGNGWRTMADAQFEQRNPYERYTKSAAGG